MNRRNLAVLCGLGLLALDSVAVAKPIQEPIEQPLPFPPIRLPPDDAEGMIPTNCTIGEVPGVTVGGVYRRAFAPPGCATVQVAPPSFGRAEVDGLTATTNIGYCPTLLSLHQNMNGVVARIEEVSRRIDQFLAVFDTLRGQVEALERELNQREAERSVAQEAFVAATSRKVELEAEQRAADLDYEDCILLEESCDALEATASTASRDLQTHLRSVYEPARIRSESATSAHQTTYAAYTAKLQELASALDPVVALQQEINTIQVGIMETYDRYAPLEGAVGALRYSVPWDLPAAAPRAPSYQPVRISAATFSATARIGGVGTSTPAISWVELPGLARVTARDGLALVETNSPEAGSAVMAVSGGVTARVGMTLLGACPFFPTGVASTQRIDAARFAANVVANASYRYDVVVPTAYRKVIVESPLLPHLRPTRGVPADPVRLARLTGTVLVEAAQEARQVAATAVKQSYETREVARRSYERNAAQILAQVKSPAEAQASVAVVRCQEPLVADVASVTKSSASAGMISGGCTPTPRPPTPRPIPTPLPPPTPLPLPAYVTVSIDGGLTFVP